MFQPVRIQVWLVAADAGASPATVTAMNNAPATSQRALAASKAQPRAATAAKAADRLWKRNGQRRRVPVAGCGRVGSMIPRHVSHVSLAVPNVTGASTRPPRVPGLQW